MVKSNEPSILLWIPMQKLEVSHSNTEEEIASKVKQHRERIEYLASTSPCPKLKVAYVLVDRHLREIAHGVNGYCEDGSPCKWTDNGHEDVHAEDELCREVMRMRISTEGTCAIGRYSPCGNCVSKFAHTGIRSILFFNMYRDVSALAKARSLGMELYYFDNPKIYVVPDQVIEYLEHNVWFLAVANKKSVQPVPGRGVPQTEKRAYIITHEKQLLSSLNMLLQEFLRGHMIGLKSDAFSNRRIDRLISQIETEWTCLQWARKNVLLAKHH